MKASKISIAKVSIQEHLNAFVYVFNMYYTIVRYVGNRQKYNRELRGELHFSWYIFFALT